jgi:hypothetical protein
VLKRRLIVLLLVVGAVFLAAPVTALAQPKPVRYVLVSETPGARVSVNATTGKVTFRNTRGYYGKFTVVIKHGQKRLVFYFVVAESQRGNSGPGPTVTIVKVASQGGGSRPSMNVEPVLTVHGRTISWAAQPGANAYKGAISNLPRFLGARTTRYLDLRLLTIWTPPAPPCGETLFYGVASEGKQGDQWTANEVSITGPRCAHSPYPVGQNAGPTPDSGLVPTAPMTACDNLAHDFGIDGQELCAFTSRWNGYGCQDSGVSNTCTTLPDDSELQDLCYDFVTELNYLAPHRAPTYAVEFDTPATLATPSQLAYGDSCWAGTQNGGYVVAFNAQNIPSGIIAAFAQETIGIFPFTLPVPDDVGPGNAATPAA